MTGKSQCQSEALAAKVPPEFVSVNVPEEKGTHEEELRINRGTAGLHSLPSTSNAAISEEGDTPGVDNQYREESALFCHVQLGVMGSLVMSSGGTSTMFVVDDGAVNVIGFAAGVEAVKNDAAPAPPAAAAAVFAGAAFAFFTTTTGSSSSSLSTGAGGATGAAATLFSDAAGLAGLAGVGVDRLTPPGITRTLASNEDITVPSRMGMRMEVPTAI